MTRFTWAVTTVTMVALGACQRDGTHDAAQPVDRAQQAITDVPPTLVITSGGLSWVEGSGATAVDPTLSLTDPDGPDLAGARVSVTSGLVPAEDRLVFVNQNGISGSYNTSTGVMTLTGSASASVYEAAMRSVTYQSLASTPTNGVRTVTFSIGANSLYMPETGHFYEFVTSPGITWTAAKAAAATRSYFGLQGYLTTITSANENAFVASKLAGQGWMGASDEAVENIWRWVTGPEGLENTGAGRYFYLGNTGCVIPYGNGTPQSGYYQNWSGCEPNNAGNEDYAHFLSDGTWNDYPNAVGSIAGYVCEYGGMPGDTVVQLSGSRNITVSALPRYNIVASAGAGGTVSPASTTAVRQGDSLGYTITPSAGYHVVSLTVDGAPVAVATSYTFSNVTAAHTIAATFSNVYTVTVTQSPHGTLSPGTASYAAGGTPSFSIAAASQYKVSDVRVDGVSVGAVTSYGFTALSADHTLTASFVLIDTPPTLVVTDGGSLWTEDDAPLAVDPALSLTDPDGPSLAGARVAFSSGYASGEDLLGFTAQNGINGTFVAATGVLTLSGTATVAQYEAALRSVTYSNSRGNATTPTAGTRQVTFSVGATSLYMPETDHFYEFVTATGISWTAAKAAAPTRYYYGLQGYLATLTSANENAFVAGKLAGQGWFGASDEASEGTWRWVTGPEGLENGGVGRWFFNQNLSLCGSGGPRGTAVGGYYQNWAGCEPNDSGGEDYAHFLTNGTWNDYPNSVGSSIVGYVVEYGGMPNEQLVQLSGTRAVQVAILPTFAISASVVGANGSLSPAGTTQVKKNHGQTYAFTPATGFHVGAVSIDGASVAVAGSYTFTAVSAAHTLAVSFAINTYGVSTTNDGNGDVSCTSPVSWGSSASCTITPSSGYQLSTFTDNGADQKSAVSGGAYTISNVVADHAVAATFKKSLGGGCSSASECGSGSCVDGVCCNSACNGQCEACAQPGQEGTCVAVSGAPVGARTACTGFGGDACGGFCDGSQRAACSYPGASTACRAASCASGTGTLAAVCDGSGTCPGVQTQACDAFVCGASACLTSCAADAECSSGNYCNAGVCQPQQGVSTSCSRDGECGTGQCVDGVCCNSACNGQCEACDETGHVGECVAVSGAPHRARAACDSDGSSCGGSCDGNARTACSYPDVSVSCRGASCASGTATLAASCDAQGHCPAVQTQSCGTFVCGASACLGNCSADTDCASGNWCSGGVCTPKAVAGASCGGDNQCGSGFCTDGVCCNVACGGQCEACDVSGRAGECVAVSGAPHSGRPGCATDGSACGGSCDGLARAACSFPTASTQCRAPGCATGTATLAAACDGHGACPAEQTQDCGQFVCGATACRGDCLADADCASGNYCSAGVCVTQKSAGVSCSGANQCGTGECVDGVCCNVACGGQCQACDVIGHAGTCTAVSGAPHGDRVACDSDGTSCGGSCDGSDVSACSYPASECRAAACAAGTGTLAATCDHGHCPAVQQQSCGQFACGANACKGDCSADAQCASGNWCSAGVCKPKSAPGASCGGDNQCGSGFCTDGVCCNVACDGQCEACDVSGSVGTCAPAVGAPHGGRDACASDDSRCGGACDGSRRSACTYPGTGTSCVTASCASGVETHGSSCNGSGACVAPQTALCGNYACGESACRSGCASDAECGTDGVCIAGACEAKADHTLWSVQGGAGLGLGCNAAGNGTGLMALLVLAVALRLARRRAGQALAVVAAGAVGLSAGEARAQGEVSRSFLLERFAPQAGNGDVLGVQSATISQHQRPQAQLWFSYADVPLRVFATDDHGVQRSLAANQETLTLAASMGLFDRLELGIALPVTFTQSTEASVVDPALGTGGSNASLADLRVQAKVRLVTAGGFAFAVSLPVTLPTGDGAYSGYGSVTASPSAIGQFSGPRRSAVMLNAGVAVRSEHQLLNLTVGSAFTYAFAARVDLLPRYRVAAMLNVGGEVGFSNPKAAQSPLEAVIAVRWLPVKSLAFTLGAGPGLSPGYGTPRFRVLASLGWVPGDDGEPVAPKPE